MGPPAERPGVPAGKVNTISEALQLAGDLGLAPVVTIGHPAGERTSRQVANPIRLSGTPAGYRLPPPELGEHPHARFDSAARAAAPTRK
ncbi:CoA transferase [Arthrobacter sp. ATA002]|uniref:CoA transferase n=1 Tax=Arthrobacter sp. ATA002 TaxID=2991715 RepID=UPI003FA46CB8